MGGFSFIKLLQTCQKSKEKLTKSKEILTIYLERDEL
jgi:hypothetical protein